MFYIWRIGKESKKPRPERPIPPSAEAVARVRSQTLENLEEEENYPSDEAVNKIPGLFLLFRWFLVVNIISYYQFFNNMS